MCDSCGVGGLGVFKKGAVGGGWGGGGGGVVGGGVGGQWAGGWGGGWVGGWVGRGKGVEGRIRFQNRNLNSNSGIFEIEFNFWV